MEMITEFVFLGVKVVAGIFFCVWFILFMFWPVNDDPSQAPAQLIWNVLKKLRNVFVRKK